MRIEATVTETASKPRKIMSKTFAVDSFTSADCTSVIHAVSTLFLGSGGGSHGVSDRNYQMVNRGEHKVGSSTNQGDANRLGDCNPQ
jgi:hypothetical protein